jgi:hypothetical protein
MPGINRNPFSSDPSGQYLREFDLEFAGGIGSATWTPDISEAHAFPTFEAAFNTWRATSATCPLRDDGRPNKPLTAYSVTFEEGP